MKNAVALQLARLALWLGGAAVLDFMDRVRLLNTPAYGHRVYTSPDGRIMVIDPVTPVADTFEGRSGIKELPRRCVLQVTSYGQAPSRAELSYQEALGLCDATASYLGRGLITERQPSGGSARSGQLKNRQPFTERLQHGR